jgi:hypothetical protein
MPRLRKLRLEATPKYAEHGLSKRLKTAAYLTIQIMHTSTANTDTSGRFESTRDLGTRYSECVPLLFINLNFNENSIETSYRKAVTTTSNRVRRQSWSTPRPTLDYLMH